MNFFFDNIGFGERRVVYELSLGNIPDILSFIERKPKWNPETINFEILRESAFCDMMEHSKPQIIKNIKKILEIFPKGHIFDIKELRLIGRENQVRFYKEIGIIKKINQYTFQILDFSPEEVISELEKIYNIYLPVRGYLRDVNFKEEKNRSNNKRRKKYNRGPNPPPIDDNMKPVIVKQEEIIDTPKLTNDETSRIGENIIEAKLIVNGWEIIRSCNINTVHGDLDIVAVKRNKEGKIVEIEFHEVKSLIEGANNSGFPLDDMFLRKISSKQKSEGSTYVKKVLLDLVKNGNPSAKKLLLAMKTADVSCIIDKVVIDQRGKIVKKRTDSANWEKTEIPVFTVE